MLLVDSLRITQEVLAQIVSCYYFCLQNLFEQAIKRV